MQLATAKLKHKIFTSTCLKAEIFKVKTIFEKVKLQSVNNSRTLYISLKKLFLESTYAQEITIMHFTVQNKIEKFVCNKKSKNYFKTKKIIFQKFQK